MSLKICYLSSSVFAIIVLGTINATASEVAKDPHTVSDHFSKARETALSSLVGRFIVVGCKPGSGQTYRGSVDVSRQGNSLNAQESINGKIRTGTGTIVFEPETPTLEIVFVDGIRAGYESWPFGARQEPRASGWVDLANGDYHDRERLGMEVWYDDQPAPQPASVQTQLNSALKDHAETDLELLQMDIGGYRIIGEDTGNGRVYTGKVRVQFVCKQLKIDGSIDGKALRGEMVRFTDSKPTLIKYRVGAQSMLALTGCYSVGDNYPRFCGYFYPVSASGQVIPNSQPRLETWFFDWK
jgi:hypothetical protein